MPDASKRSPGSIRRQRAQEIAARTAAGQSRAGLRNDGQTIVNAAPRAVNDGKQIVGYFRPGDPAASRPFRVMERPGMNHCAILAPDADVVVATFVPGAAADARIIGAILAGRSDPAVRLEPYRVMKRASDNLWCIFTPKFSVVVAEFVEGADAEAAAIANLFASQAHAPATLRV